MVYKQDHYCVIWHWTGAYSFNELSICHGGTLLNFKYHVITFTSWCWYFYRVSWSFSLEI